MANSSMAMWAVTVNKDGEISAIYDTDGESRQLTSFHLLSGDYKTVWPTNGSTGMPTVKSSNWAYDDAGLIKLIFKIGR